MRPDFKKNGSLFSERLSLLRKTVAFLFVVGRSRRSYQRSEEALRTFTVCEVVDEWCQWMRRLLAKSTSAVEYRKGPCLNELFQPL